VISRWSRFEPPTQSALERPLLDHNDPEAEAKQRECAGLTATGLRLRSTVARERFGLAVTGPMVLESIIRERRERLNRRAGR
jgi:hypothetical protein